jgi:vacuole morphology and inheritance protein 14
LHPIDFRKLSADTDETVKGAAELLDRLLKDIINEQKSSHVTSFSLFSLDEFLDLLRERIPTLNPHTRSFLVAWLSTLDSVPGIELVSSIHVFLPGLFKFLGDENEDVRVATSNLLAELLREISEAVDLQRRLGIGFGALERSIYGDSLDRVDLGVHEGEAGDWVPAQNMRLDFPRMITLLLPFLEPDRAQEVRVTCLQWVNEFILLARQIMLPFAAGILKIVLPAISQVDMQIQSTSSTTNSLLFTLITESDLNQDHELSKLDLTGVLSTILELCVNELEETRLGCLEWLLMLHKKSSTFVLKFPNLLPTVFQILSDPVEDVVKRALQLVAQISSFSESSQFDSLMADILSLFSKDRNLLESRGSLIVRQLCLALSPEDVYRSFSQVLEKEDDLEFAGTMITNLNIILITSVEFINMRKRFRAFEKVVTTFLIC